VCPKAQIAAERELNHENGFHFQSAVWPIDLLSKEDQDRHKSFLRYLKADAAFSRFWHNWYLAMWEGRFTDWDLAVEVAEIPNDVWEAGAEAVAAEIERIRSNRTLSEESNKPSEKEDAPHNALTTSSKENIVRNRDAIALNAAALIDQLTEFKERIRGLNHLEPEIKQEVLDFIENLEMGLEALLASLPKENAPLSDDEEVVIGGWLDKFYPLMKTNAKHYVSPDNVSEAALPVSFILGFTAIGTMIAGPAGGGVGALVGGLITGQVKPGKAADELMEQGIDKGEYRSNPRIVPDRGWG
jgi:hypothetical protein